MTLLYNMKKNLFKLSFVFILVWFFWSAGQAKADSATTTIRLQIKTNDASLYDQNIDVTACADRATASTTSINALCALEQSGVANNWSWYGDLAFLNSIGSYVNNGNSNGIYWGWFENLNYSDLALNQYILKPGDKILLAYNINPLKISIDNATPYVNITSTITLEQFGLDSSWNPVWSPAASSTLVIAGQEVNNDSGVYEYTATTTAPVLIHGKKSGYINSDEITVTGREKQNSNPPVGGSVIIIPAAGGSAGAAAAVVLSPKVDLGKAIDFLISKQSADGSYGAALQTDWAAMALASANPNGAAAQKTKSYLLSDQNPLVGMNPVSDYARRAMALMSLNINPYSGTKTNYIKKIADLFDGKQFGDVSLYNDDIFALLVLNKAGYAADDKMIKQAVNFVIAKQQADGSWGGADLTAAAIQALEPLSSLDSVGAAISKARNFLVNAQGANGGYGNTYTTAWVMQAIAALGENSGDWKNNNNMPESYLALSQGADGGLEKDNAYAGNRVWSTAYAIPAVQGKPWLNIMNSFLKMENQVATEVNLNTLDNPAATSTPEKLDIATSSPEDLITASSTGNSLQIKALEEKTKPETVKTFIAFVKPVKRIVPKVLAAEITLKKPASLENKQAEKQSQEVARKKTSPAAAVKSISNSAAPAVSPPMPKTNFLALTGRLIYRGLRYVEAVAKLFLLQFAIFR